MSAIMIVMDMCFVFLLFFLCVASESLAKVLDVEPKRNGESDLSYGERLNEALRRFYVAHLDHVDWLMIPSVVYNLVSKYFESDVQVAGTCTVMQCSAMRAKVQLPGIYCIADNRIKATYSRGISGFHRIINLKVKLQSRLTIAIKTTHVLCGTVGGRGAMLLIQLSQYSTGPRAINCG
ncbi:hypothetical protein MSG28_002642 [Choristoneura fumiferana]|uniref:Uncharacterized protein n=1 Tax=Choristoneura fumiferana TaxID=7141 RepID=A0ACC0JII8_CHOFU|nr:hypothetical protein MSG28_002642 [Choristoneura fumiferana]